MSGAGNDAPPITSLPSHLEQQPSPLAIETFIPKDPENGNTSHSSDMATQTLPLPKEQRLQANMASEEDSAKPPIKAHPPRIRIHFDEFAAQIRLHRQKDRHARMLRLRLESLQKSIAITQRLHRVGRLVQDGLVSLAHKNDKTGFARVYHSMNELSDSCNASQNSKIWPKDTIMATNSDIPDIDEETPSFISKISHSSREDLFRLLNSVRSEPSFLLERINALSEAQVDGLCLAPGEEAQSGLPQFPQARNSTSQETKRKYASSFEDCATSLERKSPLEFMLCNAYGDSQDSEASEYSLRLNTWSTVCAELYLASEDHNKLIRRVFFTFASFHNWRVSERLELFLMDILQRGAVLLELVDRMPPSSYRTSIGPFGTPEAEDFFEEAVQHLIAILYDHDGGLPKGVLQLVCETVGKMTFEADQGRFRGFVMDWFAGEFLRFAIDFPETQDMLLKCYISKNARAAILTTLWKKTYARVWDALSAGTLNPVPDFIQFQVDGMVAKLEGSHIPAPSQPSNETATPTTLIRDERISAYLMICPTDLIYLIDTLCPQPSYGTTGPDNFLIYSRSAFQNQYAQTNSKTNFDQLRRELALFTQPSLSLTSRLVHPCQENWTICHVGSDGKLNMANATVHALVPEPVAENYLGPQDCSQEAAMRLVGEHRTSSRSLSSKHIVVSQKPRGHSLVELFEDEYRYAEDRADNASAHYWHEALKHLRQRYPASRDFWGQDDTTVLRAPTEQSQQSQAVLELEIMKLESQMLDSGDLYQYLRKMVAEASNRMDRLRDRLWYAMDVVNSTPYEEAKSLASALNNMSVSSILQGETFGDLPDTASLTGSLFSQSQKDIIGMLKAPSEHGGPKKLADAQLDMIIKWLSRNSIENFCSGEERIHRFCMEIKLVAKKLAAENLNDSPVLWSSELYKKERDICFESNSGLVGGSSAGTRPASVRSETLSSTHHNSRSSHHGFEQGPRISSYDAWTSPARKSSFHSFESNRIRTHGITNDVSSMTNGSPDRAYSSGGSEVSTLYSMFSPAAPQSQSATTVSSRSRPASTYNDIENAKLADKTAKEKSKFLEELQQELVCLLLSDLGCPVWSCGSETDARLASMCADSRIAHRMRQRQTSSRLLSQTQRSGRRSKQTRSASTAPEPVMNRENLPDTIEHNPGQNPVSWSDQPFSYNQAYQALLDKCSQQVDPMDKLQAIYDIKLLVEAELRESADQKSSKAPAERQGRIGRSAPASRRSSFDPSMCYIAKNGDDAQGLESKTISEVSRGQVVDALKRILQGQKSKTLFRDLQYVSVFVPSEVLNKTVRGGAFTDFGLAAIGYKADVAQAMVDVADRIIADDLAKRKSNGGGPVRTSPEDATQILLLAAQEGNPIAQREVASLYLSQPELMPIVSLPLTLPNETFKHEMMWQKKGGNTNTQAMCLALHWMQLAAKNGDKIAQEKMSKRGKGVGVGVGISIR